MEQNLSLSHQFYPPFTSFFPVSNVSDTIISCCLANMTKFKATGWAPSILFNYACTMDDVVENIDHVFVHGEEDQTEGIFKPRDISNWENDLNISNESTLMYISSSDDSNWENDLNISNEQYQNIEETRQDREDDKSTARGGGDSEGRDKYQTFPEVIPLSEVISNISINKEVSEKEDEKEVKNEFSGTVIYQDKTEPINEVEAEGEHVQKPNFTDENEENLEPTIDRTSDSDCSISIGSNDVKMRVYEAALNDSSHFVAGHRLYPQALKRYERLAALADIQQSHVQQSHVQQSHVQQSHVQQPDTQKPDTQKPDTQQIEKNDSRQQEQKKEQKKEQANNQKEKKSVTSSEIPRYLKLYQDGVKKYQRYNAPKLSNSAEKCEPSSSNKQTNNNTRFIRLYNLSKSQQVKGRARRMKIEKASEEKSNPRTKPNKISVRQAEKLYYRLSSYKTTCCP